MQPPNGDDVPSDFQPSTAEKAAMDWICRIDRGLTPAQAAKLQAWRAADPEHERLFAEYQGTWLLLGERASAGHGASKLSWTSLLLRRLLRFGPIVGAAAALVLVYVSWWRPAHYSATAATRVGELYQHKLPDGSELTLNTDSAVEIVFSPSERHLRLLRGQLHVDVAKDRERPLVVEASGVSVRAVGTAFDVRLRTTTVEVVVEEGTVAVAPVERAAQIDSDNVTVSAGKRVVLPVVTAAAVTVPPAVDEVDPRELQRAQAWRFRRLEFVASPLSEIVAEFNRYNQQQLVVADAEIAQSRFGGVFRADDYEGLVRMLRENFGVLVETKGDRTLLRSAPERKEP